jgi:hypothetical protein
MGLTTSPVCASCQLPALHFVCVCPTLATLRARIFGKPTMNVSDFTAFSASAILRVSFQSGRLETNLSHNSFKCVRRLLIYDSSINVLFVFFCLSFFYSIFFRLISLFTSHLEDLTLGPNRDPRAEVLFLSGVVPPFLFHLGITVIVTFTK